MGTYEITGTREAVIACTNARLNNKRRMYMLDLSTGHVWCETKDIEGARARENVFALRNIYADIATPEYLESVTGEIMERRRDKNDALQMTDAEFDRWADKVCAILENGNTREGALTA